MIGGHASFVAVMDGQFAGLTHDPLQQRVQWQIGRERRIDFRGQTEVRLQARPIYADLHQQRRRPAFLLGEQTREKMACDDLDGLIAQRQTAGAVESQLQGGREFEFHGCIDAFNERPAS